MLTNVYCNVEVVAADKKCTGWNIDQKDMFETKQQLSISERQSDIN